MKIGESEEREFGGIMRVFMVVFGIFVNAGIEGKRCDCSCR